MARHGLRSGAILLFAGVQVSLSQEVPTEMPMAGFPGPSAAASNAAWPSGAQPQRLAAWPTSGYGVNRTVGKCWKTTTLHDTEQGWPGVCTGLQHAPNLKTEEECMDWCRGDSRCPVWQYNNQSNPGQCWVGFGNSCATRTGNSVAITVQRSQRVMHGDVRVLKNLTGLQVLNLYSMGKFVAGDEDLSMQRCKAWCYSNIGCEYWQYSLSTGCFVDWAIRSTNEGADPTLKVQYPLTLDGGATEDAAWPQGEYIQHYCPPDPYNTPATPIQSFTPAPPQEGGGMSWGIYAIGALVCLLGVLGCLYYFMMQGQGADGRPRRGGGAKGRKVANEADYEYDFQEEDARSEDKPLMKSGRGSGMANDSYNMQPPPPPYPGQDASTPTMQQQVSMPPPTQLVDFGGQPGYGQGGAGYSHQHPPASAHQGMRPPQLMQQGMPFPRPGTQNQFAGR